MNRLDSRQAELLKALLNTQQAISSRNLGQKLGISARMVRYNLPVIQGWLAERGAALVFRPRAGIILISGEAERRHLAAELQQERVSAFFGADDRLHLLLFEFLSEGEFLTSAALEKRLFVSHGTLRRDLERAEKWLADHHLYLQRKPRLGMAVVGREEDYRHALVALVLQACTEMALIDLFHWGKNAKDIAEISPHSLQAIILRRISGWNPPVAWRYTSQIENELHITLADRDQLFLALYCTVMVWRYRQARVIAMPEDKVSEARSLAEYRALEAISERFYRDTSLRIPEVELAHLSLQIATSLHHSRDSSLLEAPYPNDRQDIPQAFAERLIADIGARMQCDLAHPEVLERMTNHLRRSVTRLRYGMPIDNALTEQVHAALPDLWQATERSAAKFQAELGLTFPPEEIAYLTMYMGLAFDFNQKLKPREATRVIVACPSGGITVWMLVSRLRSELPELEIVEVVSMRQLNAIRPQRASAIISTAAFNSRFLPVITVSPFVTEQDVSLIRRELGLAKKT